MHVNKIIHEIDQSVLRLHDLLAHSTLNLASAQDLTAADQCASLSRNPTALNLLPRHYTVFAALQKNKFTSMKTKCKLNKHQTHCG